MEDQVISSQGQPNMAERDLWEFSDKPGTEF